MKRGSRSRRIPASHQRGEERIECRGQPPSLPCNHKVQQSFLGSFGLIHGSPTRFHVSGVSSGTFSSLAAARIASDAHFYPSSCWTDLGRATILDDSLRSGAALYKTRHSVIYIVLNPLFHTFSRPNIHIGRNNCGKP